MPPPAELVAALHAAVARGGRVLAVCSGAFLLAAAGLLDGRRAATHWQYAPLLAARYPQVDVDADVLYVEDGPVVTSAGTAAAIDACLHLVRQAHGATVANALARRMVVPPHRSGGQAQFVESPVAVPDDRGELAEVLTWIQEHLADPLPVRDLAARALMSPRTFARRFQGGHRHHPAPLAARPAAAARRTPARGHRPARRRHRRALRLRQPRHAPPPLRPAAPDQPHHLPADLPHARDAHRLTTAVPAQRSCPSWGQAAAVAAYVPSRTPSRASAPLSQCSSSRRSQQGVKMTSSAPAAA